MRYNNLSLCFSTVSPAVPHSRMGRMGSGMPAPCLVLPLFSVVAAMFLLLDLWTSVESFFFPFLASFKRLCRRSLFCQEAAVWENNFLSPELSKKKKYLGLFAFFSPCPSARLFKAIWLFHLYLPSSDTSELSQAT